MSNVSLQQSREPAPALTKVPDIVGYVQGRGRGVPCCSFYTGYTKVNDLFTRAPERMRTIGSSDDKWP